MFIWENMWKMLSKAVCSLITGPRKMNRSVVTIEYNLEQVRVCVCGVCNLFEFIIL